MKEIPGKPAGYPLDEDISLSELFDIGDIQKLQDQFSLTTGLATIIIDKSGAPITEATGFTRFCHLIRGTSEGLENCRRSDAALGREAVGDPVIQPCLSGGLLDAASSIKINGQPIAFWLIGQVRDGSLNEKDIRRYAREIGADEETVAVAFGEIPIIPRERFEHTVNLLSLLADQLSTIAYQNYNIKRNESYLRTLINTIPDLFWMKDREGRFLFCNPRTASFMGASAEEIIGKTDYDFVDREQAEVYRLRDEEVLLKKESVKSEIELTFASDGHREILETIKTPILRPDGSVSGIVGIGRDITAFKEAEKERQENLLFLRNLDRISQAIQKSNDLEEILGNVLEETLGIFRCHRAFFVYPCDPESPVLRIPYARHTPDVPGTEHMEKDVPMSPYVKAAYRLMLETGDLYERYEPEKGNEGNWDKFGTKAILQVLLSPKTGKPWVFALHHCQTERRWTEREKTLLREIGTRVTDSLTNLLMYRDIQEQETFISNIFENIPNMIFVKDAADLKFVRFNRAGEQLLGRDRESMLGKGDYDFFAKEMADSYHAKDREVLGGRSLVDIPRETVQTRDRGERILHTQKIPLLNPEGEPEYLLGISEDITDRLEAERELEEKRVWLQSFMESTSDAITIFDREGRIVLMNGRALAFYPEGMDREKVLGSQIGDYFKFSTEGGATFLKYYNLAKETKQTYLFQERHGRDRDAVYFSHKVFPVGEGIGFISNDITEQRNLEEQLQQIQKVESIGRLAGGVAHDFNNILGIIMGYAEMALNSEKKDEDHDAFLREIMNAAERSAELTRQLLAFARKQNARPRPLNLNATVERMLKMLKTLIGEHIDLTWKSGEDLWVTQIDPVQIDQILANLCVNARDAIGGMGSIAIGTSNQILDETYCAFHPDVIPGEYVCLSVTDDGAGMDRETLSKIFEPFFTTKGVGKGTGLGLSTVYGIVKQNGGSINVYSEPGLGTTFKVFFRRETGKTIEEERREAKKADGGNERILIIEDELALMRMTARMLKNYGYRVLTAGTKGEALRYAGPEGDGLDLILSDIVMPEMNGKELFDIIRGEHPGIKCLFMSGYTGDIIASQGIIEEGIRFIQKPFSSGELADTIRRILDSP